MSIRTFRGLREVLLNFVDNPNKSWGEPDDGNGNPVDLKVGEQIRRTPDQADINTARLNSGTYTPEQHDNFWRQVCQTENRSGIAPTPRFPGDPDELPASIPERTCSQCGKTFRSVKTKEEVKCFDCSLEALCPVLTGRHIRAYWRRDGWWLECFGDIGFHNKMTFRWSNRTSGGNVCHQALTVYRTTEGDIRKLVFSTLASAAECCYRVTFDLEADSIKFARTKDKVCTIKSDDVRDNNYANFVEIKKLDNIVLDLMVAMIPSWMLYTYHPRRNGCFPVV